MSTILGKAILLYFVTSNVNMVASKIKTDTDDEDWNCQIIHVKYSTRDRKQFVNESA